MLYWVGHGFLLLYLHKELNLGDTTMGLLSRKPKVSIEDCCRDFYDSQIFKAKISNIARMDFWSYYLAQSKDLIAEDDQAFSVVGSDTFWREMTALRMAVFGLQCSLKVHHKVDPVLRQVFFTKRYLEDNGRQDIWDAMGKYNKAIGDSAYMNANGQAADGNTRWGRARITFVNTFRWGIFKKWTEANLGDPRRPLTPEQEEKVLCLSFALQRVCADITRADCVAVKLLAVTLAERLGCDINLNQKALFKLGSIIFGFCEGAKGAIKDVVLQG